MTKAVKCNFREPKVIDQISLWTSANSARNKDSNNVHNFFPQSPLSLFTPPPAEQGGDRESGSFAESALPRFRTLATTAGSYFQY